jgi:hypothetical protein
MLHPYFKKLKLINLINYLPYEFKATIWFITIMKFFKGLVYKWA